MATPVVRFFFANTLADEATRDEVRKQARDRSEKLFKHWNELARIMERHESTLRKRWMKKTRDQRKKILITAWPNMPKSHRPDYKAFRAKQLISQRDAYLFPFINLEDLSQPKSLLIFLNARGRHPPQMFSHADLQTTHFGQTAGAIERKFLEFYTMYLTGTSPHEYGRLVSWNDDPDACMMMMKRRAFRPGDGLNTLECQERILCFLVGCCKAILHEMDEATLTGAQSTIQPEPPAISADSNEWPTAAALAQEAPYRLPALLDFQRLKAIFSAQRSASQEHVLSLREDPSYFAEIATDYFEHRPEFLPDTNGMSHIYMRELGAPKLWNDSIGLMIFEAYTAVGIWDLLDRKASGLADMQKRYAEVIDPNKELPEDYMKALLAFQHALLKAQERPLDSLKKGVPASPLLRSDWVRSPTVPGMEHWSLVMEKSGNKTPSSESSKSYMIWLFSLIWDEKQRFLHGTSNIMDELERLFEDDPKARALLSKHVSDRYSDLGLLTIALHEISMYLPWAASMEDEFEDHKEVMEKEHREAIEPLYGIYLCWQLKKLSLAKLGAPTKTNFEYPSDKRRTQRNLNIMRQSEKNLDVFWNSVDLQYKNLYGHTLLKAYKNLLPQDRQIERTPEWVEPEKVPIRRADAHDADHITIPFGHSDSDHTSKPTFESPKEKSKTRGVATDSAESDHTPEEASPANLDTQPRFQVSRKVAKVFSILFHTLQTADQPGEIPWSDFLGAMVATGFNPSKLYGSVWQFTPTRLDVERSIQFHEPHPRSKITFRVARRIGRRLNRAYGWHGGMFEVV